MQNKDSKVFKQAVTIVGVVALTTVIGVALSAQMGPGTGPMGGQGLMSGPGGHGMRGGPGMMGGQGDPGGRGMMGGPGGRRGQRGGPGMMGGPLGMRGRGMRELGVTGEQRKQIREKMESHKAEFDGIAEKMGPARKALEDAITAETINEVAIGEAAKAVAAVEVEAAVLRAKVHQDVFSVLTDAQKAKAKELRGQTEQRMKEGRERMRKNRQPIKQSTEETRGGSELV